MPFAYAKAALPLHIYTMPAPCTLPHASFTAKIEQAMIFKDHPRQLIILFFTEIWERFSYYGMRALLMLYMTKQLLYGDEQAYAIYGAYGSLVYATPLIGGMLADRILGQRKAIILGSFIMMCGHFVMAFPTQHTFYAALALIVIGNGFFKPNMAPLISQLYRKDDPRRDGGFTIFYMGVNIGAVVSPLACGWVGETIGWHYGFGLAGVGMMFGLLLFSKTQKMFGDNGLPPNPADAQQKVIAGLSKIDLVGVGAFLATPLFMLLLNQNQIMSYLLGIVGATVVIYVGYTAFFNCTRIERHRLIVAMFLIFCSVLFWSFFEQGGSSLTLYADRNVDRQVLSYTLNASQTNAINPLFIILLATPFANLWVFLSRRNLEPSTPMKFAIAMVLQGLGFYIFALGGSFAGSDALVPLFFLMFGYFMVTAGELSLSPVGLGMVTKLSPARIVSFMMGVWFLSTSFAHHFAALIGRLTSPAHTADSTVSAAESLAGYTQVFKIVFWVSIAAGIILMALSKPLTKWMHDEEA